MESQCSLDLEQTRSEKTSTSTVGPSPSLGTPARNVVFEEPGEATVFFLDAGNGELTLHVHVHDHIKHIPINLFKRLNDKFLTLCVLLEERGMKSVRTWVDENREDQMRLAQFFGFRHTGECRKVTLDNGQQYFMDVMEFSFRDEDG